jgi:hypothetical protein
MSTSLESLANLPGVTGLCQHTGSDVGWSRLPDDVSSERAAALCAAISSAFSTYAGAGRILREVWFEFPGFAVLVISSPNAGPEEFLTFFLSDREAAAAITGAIRGNGFFRR